MLGEAHEILQGRAEDEFGSGRVFIWKNVWQAVKERPLFGGGPDTLSHRITAYFERYDEATNIMRRSGIDTAHNEYLNILANQGILHFSAGWPHSDTLLFDLSERQARNLQFSSAAARYSGIVCRHSSAFPCACQRRFS